MKAKESGKDEKLDRKNSPGSGSGKYYRVEVRPKHEFVTFRYHDVGDTGHIQRLAGKRESGSWDTHAWLISKTDAHVEENKLVPDTDDAKRIIATFRSEPKHKNKDTFFAKDRIRR
jgi:hypothetical protein